MVNTIYQKSFAALMKRPFRLWGISLLGALLCWLAGIGFAAFSRSASPSPGPST